MWRQFMRSALSAVTVTIAMAACGGASEGTTPTAPDPYTSAPDKTVVIGPNAGAGTVTATPVGTGCIQLPSGECVKPQDKCKPGERADIIIDSRGKMIETVCYPASSSPTPINGSGNVEIGKANGAIVAVGDVAGDITSNGNNVTVYGQGPGASVIGGKVQASGNNYAMRGVTVKGDVRISGNNAALVLCVVEGDLIVVGNNAVIADCTVVGKIKIEGNNAVLVANEVGRGIELGDAKNAVCDANVVWNDANGNRLLDPGESGSEIACATK